MTILTADAPFNITLDLEYLKGEFEVTFASYNTDQDVPVILLTDINEYDQEVATVNLAGYGIFPEEGNVIISDYSPIEGMADALIAAGVLTEVVRRHSFGFVQDGGAECKVNPKFIQG